ncbi:hypothetical protein Golomagni_05934, partial [Golovinomyces magnicellulatus]
DGVNCIPADLCIAFSHLHVLPSRPLVKYLQPKWLHNMATTRVSELMAREEANTDFECLAPVNKAFHTAVAYFEDGPNTKRLQRHREKIDLYLWLGPQGLSCNGTNGVQVWDTAFTVQAAAMSGIADLPQFRDTLNRAHQYLEQSQLTTELNDPFRQRRKGGWPFSTKSNGYIVSDCAAEGLKAVLMLQKEQYVSRIRRNTQANRGSAYPELISDSRLKDCVDTLLTMQNSNGGFASYEMSRGSEYLELLNPAEVFDKIMVEYAYCECTSAVMSALLLFQIHFPSYRTKEIETVTRTARQFIYKDQRPDGCWYGSWAICFNYATFLTLQALEVAGDQYHNNKKIRKACEFLLSKQLDDGGWGEHHSSCGTGEYVSLETGQAVGTAWAVLALMHAGYPDPVPIQRGLQFIESRQQPNGEWLQEALEGVFNRTCMIGYPNYKFYFPIMALGSYSKHYLPKLDALQK